MFDRIFPTDMKNQTRGATIDILYVASFVFALVATMLGVIVIAVPWLARTGIIVAGFGVSASADVAVVATVIGGSPYEPIPGSHHKTIAEDTRDTRLL